jgi:trehalose-6-phosphatase
MEQIWSVLPGQEHLRLLRFDGGMEICTATKNKGDAIHTIAAEMEKPFTMAYLGDDTTDEDAFRAIKGIGLGVLVKDIYQETSADVWIQPPEGVTAFLRRWAEACRSHL